MLELAFPSISANALFLLALLNRYAAIVARIRSMDRERISPHPSHGDMPALERLREENDYQTRMLLMRARLMRRAIGLLMASMTLFALQGCLAVVHTMWTEVRLRHLLHTLLMVGFGLVAAASGTAAYEIYVSLKTVFHEAETFRQIPALSS